MKWNPPLGLLLLSVLFSLSACAQALTYSAEPIEAWVINAETKQPLEGVIVTANWQLEEGTFGGSVPAGQLMVMEAVTDRDGKFTFPGWGPLKPKKGHLVDQDPRLLFFKSGYESRWLQNEYNSSRELRTRPIRRSDWKGKRIEMKKFTGTSKEWFKMLERSIPPIDGPEDTKKISTLLKAILAEENSIPDSIERKHVFFDGIVRYFLEGK